MERQKTFFEKLARNPSVLWKACAAVLFISFSVCILVVPSITQGLTGGLRNGFAGLMLVYGIYRAATFYAEYNTLDDE